MSHSDRISECRAVVRTQLLHDSTHSGWERRNFCSACTSGCWARFGDAGSDVDVHLIGGPSGTAHPSDSCVVVFTEIDADLESQAGNCLRSSRRIHQVLVRRTATHIFRLWSALLRGTRDAAEVEESCARSPPGSAEEEQVGLSLPVAKARRANNQRNVRRQAGSRPLLRSVNAKPNLLAGWPSTKSVELLPFPTPCSLSPAMLGIPAASRKSSSPAPHETRTLCGAGADISRIRLPVKPSRAVPPKSDVPPRQPLDLAEVLAKLTTVLDRPRSSRSLEEEFGVDPGVATTETEHTEVLNGGGSGEGVLQRLGVHAQVQRILRPRHEYPGVIILAHDTSHRDRRRSPRREQNRRIRTPARDVVSDLRGTRVCSEGQWPRLDIRLARCSDCPTLTLD